MVACFKVGLADHLENDIDGERGPVFDGAGRNHDYSGVVRTAASRHCKYADIPAVVILLIVLICAGLCETRVEEVVNGLLLIQVIEELGVNPDHDAGNFPGTTAVIEPTGKDTGQVRASYDVGADFGESSIDLIPFGRHFEVDRFGVVGDLYILLVAVTVLAEIWKCV